MIEKVGEKMIYTKPDNEDGCWDLEHLSAFASGELESVDVYKKRPDGSRAGICIVESPDIGNKNDVGPSAGDMALISYAPKMFELLKAIRDLENDGNGRCTAMVAAECLVTEIEQFADSLISEAEDAYANAED